MWDDRCWMTDVFVVTLSTSRCQVVGDVITRSNTASIIFTKKSLRRSDLIPVVGLSAEAVVMLPTSRCRVRKKRRRCGIFVAWGFNPR